MAKHGISQPPKSCEPTAMVTHLKTITSCRFIFPPSPPCTLMPLAHQLAPAGRPGCCPRPHSRFAHSAAHGGCSSSVHTLQTCPSRPHSAASTWTTSWGPWTEELLASLSSWSSLSLIFLQLLEHHRSAYIIPPIGPRAFQGHNRVLLFVEELPLWGPVPYV